jgi:cardiolipin synthase A/B
MRPQSESYAPSIPSDVAMLVEDMHLFTEGDELYAAMLESIGGARDSVYMESYIFADDEIGWQFAQALVQRAEVGVNVRLHLDAAGLLINSSHIMERYLRKKGVLLKLFHRWSWQQPLRYNRRNHRKLLIIDGQIAYVGGFNIHRQSARRLYGETRWRDTHIRFSGTLVKDAAQLFDQFWRGIRSWTPPQHNGRETSLVSNNMRTCRHMIRCLYSEAFANARKRIFLTTPYFVPDLLMQQWIIQAAHRGLDVRLLVPSKSDVSITQWAAHAFYDGLLSAGVRIYEYQPRMLHAKIVVIDDNWATVGTANLDYRSFFLNFELLLAIRNSDICSQLGQQFLDDLSESRPIILDDWSKRSWPGRVLEMFGWIVRRWL